MEKNGHIKLQSIANILLINIQHIDKLGLWNGKMGVILFFYHYGRYVDKSFYEDVADSLLDLVIEAVSRSAHSDSYALLSSVGIGIEYLLKVILMIYWKILINTCREVAVGLHL